ncbi:hypothetical protein [Metabacillus niabensis]|uniref:Transcriptional regulator n=1 Tax=Metabacillus niabensis TaxID=324854 RepID=A0ABT9Z0S6_9BACI|nr:hypothetical protein [Metabacillus niabensis]MDQ0225153.1 hypothetical protein [Metabacillus niabensis]
MKRKERLKKGFNEITASAKDLQRDPTPEDNPKYGSKSHKNS